MKHLTAPAAIAAALFASGAQANLIGNGGFEAGDTGFVSSFTSVTPLDPGLGSYSIRGSFLGLSAKSGSLAMFVNGFQSQQFQRIWGQDIAVTAGATYEISGQVGTWANRTPLGAFDIVFGGGLVGSVTAPAADDTWAPFSFSWVAPQTGNFDLDFIETANSFGATDYALDDLSMTRTSAAVVPLPAGLPLLVAALGGLALARRRASVT